MMEKLPTNNRINLGNRDFREIFMRLVDRKIACWPYLVTAAKLSIIKTGLTFCLADQKKLQLKNVKMGAYSSIC
jgi:hypothetical protein